jgi:hypothetical protein
LVGECLADVAVAHDQVEEALLAFGEGGHDDAEELVDLGLSSAAVVLELGRIVRRAVAVDRRPCSKLAERGRRRTRLEPLR